MVRIRLALEAHIGASVLKATAIVVASLALCSIILVKFVLPVYLVYFRNVGVEMPFPRWLERIVPGQVLVAIFPFFGLVLLGLVLWLTWYFLRRALV